MKKTIKTITAILSAIMLLSSIVTAGAVSFPRSGTVIDDSGKCGESVTYKFDSSIGKLTISGNGKMYDYKRDSSPWAHYRQSIRKIDVQNGVTHIGDYAFYNFINILNVKISNSVASIGCLAFGASYSIRCMTIPGSVTSFYMPFTRAHDLNMIILEDGIPYLQNDMFYDCPALKSLYIPKSVTGAAANSFRDTNNLSTIYGVAGTFAETFAREKGLNFIEVKDDSGYCGSAKYEFNSKTGKLTISGEGGISTDPWRAYNMFIKNVEIKPGVTNANGFSGCTNLQSVIIPSTVTTIDRLAFSSCDSLESVDIPNSVTSIGEYAFSQCITLENMSLGKGITEIGICAFSYCYLLSNIVIPDGVTKINSRTFENSDALTSITIPESVTSIGNDVFYSLEKLTIYGYSGSYAQSYANENNIKFVVIEKPIDTDTSTDSEIKPVDTDTSTDSEIKPVDTDTSTDSDMKPIDTDTTTDSDEVPTDTEQPQSLTGDVNNDGVITMLDVVQVQRKIAKLVEFSISEQIRADVNKDDKNTMEDVVLIQKYIAKLIDSFADNR